VRHCLNTAFGAALLLAATLSPAAPAVYVLDPDHSFVFFEVLHFGTSTLRGRFGPLTEATVVESTKTNTNINEMIRIDFFIRFSS
jgi:polyisoprenoid-binding protein YceI